MKTKLILLLLILTQTLKTFSQTNAANGIDNRVSFCNLIPLGLYSPPNTLRFNMGCDKLNPSNQKPDWIAIVSDYYCDSTGGSSLYLQKISNPSLDIALCIDSSTAPNLSQACDPDVAYSLNSLIVAYYRIDFATATVYFYAKKYDISGGTIQCHTPNLIGTCTWVPGIIPSINVDANQLGDIAIVYSDCTQNSYVFWTTPSSTFPGSGSLVSYTGLTSSTQADITIDEGSNPTVFVTYLTNNSQIWEVVRYNSSSYILEFSQSLLTTGTAFDEPRIASPAKASGSTRWSSCVCQMDINTNSSDIFFVCSDLGLNLSPIYSLTNGNPTQLTNTITSQPLNPLWMDIYNRPSIAYNNTNCNSISVNYYTVAFRNHLGVEIDDLFNASSYPNCTYRVISSANPANTLQVNNCLCYGDPNATCGRFSDVKVATFNCNLLQIPFSTMAHYSHIYDCVGSWRAYNGQIKPVNHIKVNPKMSICSVHPNPTSENIFLNITEIEEYNYKIYNSLGLLVKSGIISANNVSTDYEINTKDLMPGIYQISISGTAITNSLKFIKQ